MASKKQDRYDRFLDLTSEKNEADTMRRICAAVASGATLVEWCDLMEVDFGYVVHWLRSEKERNRLWVECQNDRKEWIKDTLLVQLRDIISSDLRKVFDDNGEMRPVHEWPDDVARFVSSIEQDQLWEGKGKDKEVVGQTKKIKMWDKAKAIELLGKHIEFLTENIQHSGKITLEDLVNASREDDDGK
jgi:hypothetical protein